MKVSADWLQSDASQRLLCAFSASGFQTLFVGGCVRNALLKKPVADLDVATAAPPHRTLEIAQKAGFRAVPTGIDHGTITVIVGDVTFEITSFRKDVETHGRRAVVAFSDNITDDARRRDFTMNALYVGADGVVVDPLGGLPDLMARRVLFIEDPDLRIKEDFLRILRYFRFHAWYGDQDAGMDAEALAAIAQNLDGLSMISKERIGAEVRKLLKATDPVRAVCAMETCGVLGQILPGSSAKHLGPLVHLEQGHGDWQRRLLALGGQDVKNMLRLSNAEARRYDLGKQALSSGENHAVNAYRFGADVAWDAALNLAAILGTPPNPDTHTEIERGAGAHFPVTAKDLPPDFSGIALGAELRRLEDFWVNSGFEMTKSDVLAKCSRV